MQQTVHSVLSHAHTDWAALVLAVTEYCTLSAALAFHDLCERRWHAGKLDGQGTMAAAAHRQSRHTHFDERLGAFKANPAGPFEADPKVHDEPTSHEHFTGRREIKFRNPRCKAYAITHLECVQRASCSSAARPNTATQVLSMGHECLSHQLSLAGLKHICTVHAEILYI